jgi:hypothetical protein
MKISPEFIETFALCGMIPLLFIAFLGLICVGIDIMRKCHWDWTIRWIAGPVVLFMGVFGMSVFVMILLSKV